MHVQECYGSSVCVCVSHLTSGASVGPENTVTYSAGNGGKKMWGFLLNRSVAEIQHSSVESHMYSRPFSGESTHALYSSLSGRSKASYVCVWLAKSTMV